MHRQDGADRDPGHDAVIALQLVGIESGSRMGYDSTRPADYRADPVAAPAARTREG